MTIEEFKKLKSGTLLKLTAEIYLSEEGRWEGSVSERFITFINHLPLWSPPPPDYTHVDAIGGRNKFHYCEGNFLIDGEMRTLRMITRQLELVE